MAAVSYNFDWIGLTPPDVQRAIFAEMTPMSLPAGAMLYERNSVPKGVYRLVCGKVRLFFLTEGGRELLLKIFGPPESFGDLAAVDGLPYPVFAETQEDCDFQFLPRESLCALREKYPVIDTALLHYMTDAARLTLQLLEEVTVFTLQARIAARLSKMVDRTETMGKPISALKVPQRDIGLMVGASRQAVNKVLSDFQKLGVVRTQYGAVIIEDIARLRELGDQSAKLSPANAGVKACS